MEIKLDTVVRLCDWHIPYHDPKAIEIALRLTTVLKPTIIVIDEVMDWYSVSRFDKDPHRRLYLQKNLNMTKKYLGRLRSLFPNTRIIMVESNHDKRLQKYLNSQASELSVLDCLNLKELMGLDTFNIEYKKFFIFKKVLFKHGNIVRQHSGYTARAEMLKEGTSGSSGHTHRLGSHYKTLRGGKYVWVEGGCLCDPKKAEYIEGTANWQQGVTGFDFPKGSKRFYPFIIPIIDSKAIFAKKLYK